MAKMGHHGNHGNHGTVQTPAKSEAPVMKCGAGKCGAAMKKQ